MSRTPTTFQKGCPAGPGRPKGSKDRVPRGLLKKVYQEFIELRGGHEAMLEALKAGIKDKRRALGFLELGARVLDKTAAGSTPALTFIVNTPG